MTKKKVIIIIVAVTAVVLLIYIPIVAVYFSLKQVNKDNSLDNVGIIKEEVGDLTENPEVNNENLLHYYTCDKNNLCGLEEVYSYKDHVLLVLDKKILDLNAEEYGGSFRNTVKGIYSADAELSILNAYPAVTLKSTTTLDNDKYVISVPFTYDKADILDSGKDVESVEVGLNDTIFIDYYNSRIVITIQSQKNDKYEILNQWYDEKECVWGDVKSDVANERQNFL